MTFSNLVPRFRDNSSLLWPRRDSLFIFEAFSFCFALLLQNGAKTFIRDNIEVSTLSRFKVPHVVVILTFSHSLLLLLTRCKRFFISSIIKFYLNVF